MKSFSVQYEFFSHGGPCFGDPYLYPLNTQIVENLNCTDIFFFYNFLSKCEIFEETALQILSQHEN